MVELRGISYLVGEAGPEEVARDLEVVAGELNCNSVMVICPDVPRLIDAARCALDLGLDVLLRPDVSELSRRRLFEQLEAASRAAEVLRREHPERVKLLVGSELSHTVPGIVPGPKSFIRLRLILRYQRLLRGRIDRRLHVLLTRLAETARRHFDGPVSYSAAGWERVDWSLFDFVGVSLYRAARNQAGYRDRVRALVRDHGKPVVITEFGCGAFTGADQRGAGSFQIVRWFADPPRIRGDHPRDEAVQARYLTELIDLYEDEGVHGCYVFTFAMPGFRQHEDPALDLDKAGFGVLAEQPEGGLRRKLAFDAVADKYRRG